MLADSEHRGPQCIGWVTFRVRCVFSKRSSTWPSASRISLAGADAGHERQPFLFARPASSINVACEKSHDRSVLPLHVDAGMLFAAHKTRRSGVIVTDRRPEQRWSMLWRNRGNQTHRGSRFATPRLHTPVKLETWYAHVPLTPKKSTYGGGAEYFSVLTKPYH
jgi:hypothetical protein